MEADPKLLRVSFRSIVSWIAGEIEKETKGIDLI